MVPPILFVNPSWNDEFSLGFDYVRSTDERWYLLEYNISPGGQELHCIRSPLSWWFQVCKKLNSHALLRSYMSEYTLKREHFDQFARDRNGRVVYKLSAASLGQGVSVFDEPTEWKPDLVEEFIEPRSLISEGKRFAYVTRYTGRIRVERGSISWKEEGVCRKISQHSLDSDASANARFRMNVQNRDFPARIEKCSEDELGEMRSLTSRIVGDMLALGERVHYDPRKVFKQALFGYFYGLMPNDSLPFVTLLKEIDNALIGRGIVQEWNEFLGMPIHALRAVESGLDGLILPPQFRCGDSLCPEYYEIKQRSDGNIEQIDPCGGKVVFDSNDHVFVLSEKDLPKIIDALERNYRGQG